MRIVRDVLFVGGLATATLVAQQPNEPWDAFAKLPLARQQQAAGELLAALPSSPIVEGLRKLAAAAAAPPPERAKLRAHQHGKRMIDFPDEAVVLARRVDYVFGVGSIVPREPAGVAAPLARPNARPNGKPPAKPPGKPGTAPATPAPSRSDPALLQQARHGCVPGADEALAVLQQRLDTDTGADQYAAFLHSWRNHDESFYEALDRTSGTPDSVFFFDVMLHDFRDTFAKGSGKLTGLREAHDALHDAFLAYRQYRGFREAVAWTLVLPPDAPLPSRLLRYEQRVPGAYSLRQQVTMVAHALGNDVDAIVAAALRDAPPLPRPVWNAGYDPYPAWTARFRELQPQMIERAGSTDAFLAAAEAERRELAAALRKLAAEHAQRAVAGSQGH